LGLFVVGIQPDRLGQLVDRLGQSSLAQERLAEVGVRRAEPRVNADGLGVAGDRFVETALAFERESQSVIPEVIAGAA
jgi:hypothetical protein